MSHSDIYTTCCHYKGKRVCITDKKGRRHVGRITKIDRDKVWIMPDRDYGGYGFGYWGFGPDRFGISIAIGFIASIILAPLLFF